MGVRRNFDNPPVPGPLIMGWIDLDVGAYAIGRLTCLVIDGETIAFI